MAKRKKTKKYYFSVEGETEHWYLKWLQDKINNTEKSAYCVSLDCPVQKNPLKRAKSMVVTGKTEVWHISDYESDEPIHVNGFKTTMDNMKASQLLGKQIKYQFGYSNLTFDLWIAMHKVNCFSTLAHRKNYLTMLNQGYGEKFENMAEYKHEANFKRCLSQLELSDVIDAINRAKYIMKKNQENGYILQQYKGYKYYKENPSLMIYEILEKILKDCQLL